MTKAPAIGIDLETTFSCIGVYRNGKVEIVANNQGRLITPSYLAFTDAERLMGHAAVNPMAMSLQNTALDVERLIRRKFRDSFVHSDIKHWPFKVVNTGGIPNTELD